MEGTCTNEYSDNTGRRFRSVSVTRHASLADVVDEVSVVPPLQLALGTTTTYTAWDTAGRPTMGTVLAGRQQSTVSMSYDDSRRMQSQTSNGITCTQTFDANANPAIGSCAGSTATTTVLTTQQICKG